MNATDQLPIVNIDTANEEIARLAKRLGQAAPKFIANIYAANEKIQELEAEIAKRKPTPVAAPVTPKPTALPVVPTVTAKRRPQGTGLMRSINAAILAKGGTSIAVRNSKDETEKEVTGLQRSINAAIKAQRSKSNE